MRIAIIVRPPGNEQRVRELQEVVGAVRAAGHEVRPRMTFEAGDARRFAAAAARAKLDLVVAAGGDGTINEVVNGIVRASRQPRLGIVPLGTANDFAKGLGIPVDVGEAMGVAMGGQPLAVDVARVNGRCFINVSTGGFGAEATEEAPRETKRLLGPLAYLLSGARKLVELRSASARFRADGELVYGGRFVFFAVGNARLTGGGMRIAPRADPGDGKLDVVLVGDVTRMDLLSLLPDVRAGTHLESPHVRYFRAKRFEVRAAEDVAVNADGEPQRGRVFRYGVLERPLTVMVPG